MKPPTISRIPSLFPRRWDYHYVSAKLRSDPLYPAIYDELRSSRLPLLDLGCGLGLLAFFLRERGLEIPILGLDYDQRKIASASEAAVRFGGKCLDFQVHDARGGLPDHVGNVTILDILQFFQPSEQETLLRGAAERVSPGGKLVIRSGLRDRTWRFRITVAGDLLAKATLWMKAGPAHYPAADDFHRVLARFGRVRISPLWGGTPFNNHLIVLDREA